jgi:hypothetical protein
MAAPTTFDEVLQNVGFNVHARTVLLDANRENMRLATLSTWEDEDVDNLVRTLRKTYEPAPAAAQGNAAATAGTLVYVQVRAIENLKTVAYICRHMIRCQRAPTVRVFVGSTLTYMKVERKNEYDYQDPDELPKLAKSDNATILDFIEEFPEQLARFTGTGGRPLAYVIREDVAVPPGADDPMFGIANSQYNSIRDEIIARASLTGAAFMADNKRVFEILREAISEFEIVKVWTKGFVRSKDGRGAW